MCGTTSAEVSPLEERGRKERRDLPRLPAKRKRGQERKALTILRSPELKRLALKKLWDDLFATSGAPSLNSKRRTLEDLARVALKLDPEDDRALIYPLTPKLVEEVAAAMKEADPRGAEQYLGEFRLAHIEADEALSPALARMFAKCRRSVARGLGPPKKAAELPLSIILLDVGGRPGDPRALRHPVAAYVVAEGWMLREIEEANIELAHVTVHRGPNVIMDLYWFADGT